MFETIITVPAYKERYCVHRRVEALIKPPRTDDVPRTYLWSPEPTSPQCIRIRNPVRVRGLEWYPTVVPDQGEEIEFSLWAAPRQGSMNNKRAVIGHDEQVAWLHRYFEKAGLIGTEVNLRELPAAVHFPAGPFFTITSVLYRGDALVTDPDKLRHALGFGIGNRKTFGFGLLQVYAY